MYDYSGIVYRIWGIGGVLSAIGVILLILSFLFKVDELQKRSFIVGIVFSLLGLGLAFEYSSILRNPEIQTFEGAFLEEHRNSRVAPPLPLTWEYIFKDKDGASETFYLDTFSQKNIFSDSFENNTTYRVYYESEYRIIVKVETLSN